ncbi:MAG: GntR family transcriptional regulator [Sphingobium sp.]|jgi:DNA-binding GntR family transcriptional regulator
MSKRGEVYDHILSQLLSAQVRLGQRLLVRQLCEELGVSRHPVMTALNRLDAQGLVEILPQVGCEVINPARSEISDFFIMFERQEGLLAELAAERRSELQLEYLRRLHRGMMAGDVGGQGEAGEYGSPGHAFHWMVHGMARSPLLARRQRGQFMMFDFFIGQLTGSGRSAEYHAQEHQEIVDAIAMQAPLRARMAMENRIGGLARAALSTE